MNLAEKAAQLKATAKEIPQMALVFGDAFTGKTSLVCQLARKYKVLWIDTDNGYDAIFTHLPAEFWSNITLLELRDTNTKAVAAETLWKLFLSTGPVKISNTTGIVNCPQTVKDKGEFTTIDVSSFDTDTVIVVDSLTKVSDSSMQNYLGAINVAGMDFKKKEFTHYDKQGLYLRSIFNATARLNCHVVFITHEEELEQEDGSKKLTPVCGTKNFSTQIGRFFSHCVHLSIKNKKHVVNSNTIGEMRAVAGSRSDVDIKSTEDFVKLFQRDFSKVGKELKVTAEAAVAPKTPALDLTVDNTEPSVEVEAAVETKPQSEVSLTTISSTPAKTQSIAERLAQKKK